MNKCTGNTGMARADWHKQDILDAIEDAVLHGTALNDNKPVVLKCSMDMLKKAPFDFLKTRLLCSMYIKKYEKCYYFLCVDNLEVLTDEYIQYEIDKARQIARKREDARKSEGEMWVCTYLKTTRDYSSYPPKISHTSTEAGLVKGEWFYPDSGGKKSIYANGFEFVKRIEEGA
jgi:hypothetical protein